MQRGGRVAETGVHVSFEVAEPGVHFAETGVHVGLEVAETGIHFAEPRVHVGAQIADSHVNVLEVVFAQKLELLAKLSRLDLHQPEKSDHERCQGSEPHRHAEICSSHLPSVTLMGIISRRWSREQGRFSESEPAQTGRDNDALEQWANK